MTRWSTFWPSSRWDISRPRNITVMRALLASSRNSRTFLIFVVVVVLLGPRPELHFLELDHDLLLLGLVLLLLLEVLELAVVHDLADRRLRHRADLDEVDPELLRARQRLLDRKHAELLAVGPDDPHLARLDAAVGARVAVAAASGLSLCWIAMLLRSSEKDAVG